MPQKSRVLIRNAADRSETMRASSPTYLKEGTLGKEENEVR